MSRTLVRVLASLAVVSAVLITAVAPVEAQSFPLNVPRNIRFQHSGQCLEVYQGSVVPATGTVQYTCHAGLHQSWTFLPLGGGEYQVKVGHSGQCLEVDQGGPSAGMANGDRILQWTCHGGEQQRWRINGMGSTWGINWYQLENVRSGKCMELVARVIIRGARHPAYV